MHPVQQYPVNTAVDRMVILSHSGRMQRAKNTVSTANSRQLATITFAFLCLGSAPAMADNNSDDMGTNKATVMVEVDPIGFALSGHSVHVRRSIVSVPGLVLGLGTYSAEVPSFLTDLNSENSDEGWKASMDKGFGAFADYHFSGTADGLFVGAQLAYQAFEVEREQSDERIDYGIIVAMARVGTLYKPFDSGFYILPFVGVSANFRADDNNLQIGNDSFDIAPVDGFGTLHLGWQFN